MIISFLSPMVIKGMELPPEVVDMVIEVIDVKNLLEVSSISKVWRELSLRRVVNDSKRACLLGDRLSLVFSSSLEPNWIYYACKGGDEKTISLLLRKFKSCDVNEGLRGACRGGHLEIAKWMISYGAQLNSLMFWTACRGGNLDLVKLTETKDLQYAYWAASAGNHEHILEYLNSR